MLSRNYGVYLVKMNYWPYKLPYQLTGDSFKHH